MVDTFIAPTKTFTDVLRDSSWWLPYLIGAVLGLMFAYVILHKVGLPTLVDGVIRNSKMLEDQIANSTPDVVAKIRGRIETNFKFAYAAPVIGLVIGLICSGILLGTSNFLFRPSLPLAKLSSRDLPTAKSLASKLPGLYRHDCRRGIASTMATRRRC